MGMCKGWRRDGSREWRGDVAIVSRLLVLVEDAGGLLLCKSLLQAASDIKVGRRHDCTPEREVEG
jgi:hypothetical protein